MMAPSVMVWGCISKNGVGSWLLLETLTPSNIVISLKKNLPLLVEQCFGDKIHPITFQHENARPHSLEYTVIYFQLRKLLRLRWPSKSPDLKPIEKFGVI